MFDDDECLAGRGLRISELAHRPDGIRRPHRGRRLAAGRREVRPVVLGRVHGGGSIGALRFVARLELDLLPRRRVPLVLPRVGRRLHDGLPAADPLGRRRRDSAASDIETITTELLLADMQTLEKQIPRLDKEVKGKKTPKEYLDTAQEALKFLEEGKTINSVMDRFDPEIIKSFQLMTAKPFIYVFNTDDEGLADEKMQKDLSDLVAPAEAIFLDAKFESELVELSEEEAAEMLEETGQEEAGLDKLARVGFETLGLQTYLTAGEKETRAWTIKKGWTAPQAAGVIHTDFERGFIKAEIVSYDDLVELGSMQEAKAAGKVRMEGKEYVMQDGDVVEFRFNN